MRKLFILTLITAILCTGCNSSDQSARKSLSPDNLPAFSADILISADTTLHLPGGSIIHIPAGALDANGASTAKLTFREALKISDIIKAGLLTTSNGQPLSSGGMIEIRAVEGQSVTIKKAISVKLPTPFIQKDMKLFKGERDKNGKMNWIDPQPLKPNKTDTLLMAGRALFTTIA